MSNENLAVSVFLSVDNDGKESFLGLKHGLAIRLPMGTNKVAILVDGVRVWEKTLGSAFGDGAEYRSLKGQWAVEWRSSFRGLQEDLKDLSWTDFWKKHKGLD